MNRRSESAIEDIAFVAKHVDSDYKRMLLGVAKEELQRLASEVERLKRENSRLEEQVYSFAEDALEAAEPVPLSKERIDEIVRFATSEKEAPRG